MALALTLIAVALELSIGAYIFRGLTDLVTYSEELELVVNEIEEEEIEKHWS